MLAILKVYGTINEKEYRNKLICEKVIPIAIIAWGYPAEKKPLVERYDETKVHWETW